MTSKGKGGADICHMYSLNKEFLCFRRYCEVKRLYKFTKKKSGVKVIVYTQKEIKLYKTDVNNFNRQYPILEVKHTCVFHDRFLIIDDVLAYHIGASIKDAGKKCFAISQIDDCMIADKFRKR